MLFRSTGTHARGLFFQEPTDEQGATIIRGEVPGYKIRNTIELRPQLLDRDGNVLHLLESINWIIEGDRGFFPMNSKDYSTKVSAAFCAIEVAQDISPYDLFTQVNCQAVFNTKSPLYDIELGAPLKGVTQFFSQYEIWRQLIETALNCEDFVEYFEPKENEDISLGLVWSKEIKELFPNQTLTEIRARRISDYGEFCTILQNRYLANFPTTLGE